LTVLCWSVRADGQIDRLPPLPTISPASYSDALSRSLLPEDEAAFQTGRISSHKDGVFQKLAFTAMWLDRANPTDVGVTEFELYSSFAFPMPTRDRPLIVTPGFESRLLDGPIAPDLPSELHDAYLQLRYLTKLTDRWGVDLAVSPGVHSDFQQWDEAALRITGHVIGSFEWSCDLKLVLGVLYLDRDDINFLPAAGVIWTPWDDIRFELVFPRPKIAMQFNYGDGFEDWLYLAGELGGGSWSIERAAGPLDVVTMRDYRLMLGLERKRPGGAGHRLEIGWVFGREFEYASVTPDIEPDDAVFLRAGVTF